MPFYISCSKISFFCTVGSYANHDLSRALTIALNNDDYFTWRPSPLFQDRAKINGLGFSMALELPHTMQKQ